MLRAGNIDEAWREKNLEKLARPARLRVIAQNDRRDYSNLNGLRDDTGNSLDEIGVFPGVVVGGRHVIALDLWVNQTRLGVKIDRHDG